MATSLPELSNYLSTVLAQPIEPGLKPGMLRRIKIFAELKDAQLAHLANVDSSLLKISAASFERLTGEAPALATPFLQPTARPQIHANDLDGEHLRAGGQHGRRGRRRPSISACMGGRI